MINADCSSHESFDDEAIAKIIFGHPPFQDLDDFGEISDHMFKSIKNLTKEIAWLKFQEDTRFSLLGPFLGRSLLETCLVGIAGRIDPFRLLVVRYQQMHPDFSIDTKRQTAPQWTGDILADKPNNDLLDNKKSYQSLSRALLSDHYNEIFWRPALNRTLDYIAKHNSNGPLIAQLQDCSDSDFIPKYRTKLSTLYSGLSKGVHHEFVISPNCLYDRSTVASMLDDSIYACCILGTVANRMSHIKKPISIEENLTLLEHVGFFELT